MSSKRTNYISVVMSDEERDRLDAWMDGQTPRIRSRSEAIRQLIALGLGGQPAHLVAAVPAEEGVFDAAKRSRKPSP